MIADSNRKRLSEPSFGPGRAALAIITCNTRRVGRASIVEGAVAMDNFVSWRAYRYISRVGILVTIMNCYFLIAGYVNRFLVRVRSLVSFSSRHKKGLHPPQPTQPMMPLSSRLRKLFRRDHPDAYPTTPQKIQVREIRNIGLDESTCRVNGPRENWSEMPVPPPRPRPLTALYEEPEKSGSLEVQRLQPQTQSLLFRLPLEVQLLIHEYLFGCRRLEVFFDVANPDYPLKAHYYNRLR